MWNFQDVGGNRICLIDLILHMVVVERMRPEWSSDGAGCTEDSGSQGWSLGSHLVRLGLQV